MPESAFILMALEAAHQFHATAQAGSTLVRLSNIRFLKGLQLSALNEENGIIETHFTLQNIADSRDFHFTISAATSQASDAWEEHCYGVMSFSTTSQATPSLRQPRIHNPTILETIESSKLFPKPSFGTVRMESDHANGDFTSLVDEDEHYHIDPAVLSSLLQIPAILMTGSGLPAEHQLDSIEIFEVPVGLWSFDHARFDVELRRVSPLRGSSDMLICDTNGHYMFFKGMWSKIHRTIRRKAPLRSLFYRSEVLPDITFLRCSGSLSIARVIELVTHKWPMSDFGVTGVSMPELQTIRSHLRGFHDHERARFRSLTLLSEEPAEDVSRLRTVQSFSKEIMFHMMISSTLDLPILGRHIRDGGFACVRVQSTDDQAIFDQKFDLICKIEGFDSGNWLLGRPNSNSNAVTPTRKLRIIGCEVSDVDSLREYGEFEYIQLTRQNIGTVCEKLKKQNRDKFDVIVMDCGHQSMLLEWAGCDLLPWIQSFLEQVGNILWVSIQVNANPFKNVAGSFIRTIQSENPSIKAASLVIQDNLDPSSLAQTVFEVYNKMFHESCEVEVVAQGQSVCALRYIPDDSLSASVGVIPPHMSEQGLGSSNYELSLAGPGSLVVLSSRENGLAVPLNESLYISVKASIIDLDDMASFADAHCHRGTWTGLGQFFVGTIRSEGHAKFKFGDQVVGWHLSAHKSMLRVPACQLKRVPEGMPAAEAAVHYAAYAMAFAVVRGTARARRSETIRFELPECLAEALTNVCQLFEIQPMFDTLSEVDFLVTSDITRGLLVNGIPVSMERYMISDDASHCLTQIMSSCQRLRSPLLQFQLRDFQNAFEVTEKGPGVSVLIHDGSLIIQEHLVTYRPADNLFRSDGAYVIAGGLGGLGRHLMAWMVSKGAKYFVTLSRSGLDSMEADRTIMTIQKFGAVIQIYKVDACSAEAVSQVMTEVRKERPIRGCLNMVLALDNSPFMTMKGSQWDRALRTKVDSTWNLHQATLSDELDMFIMFSSISSISGNRTQANYATGNSFQNSVAVYRKSLGLPGISIALGAISSIGVLADDHYLLRTLVQSGFQVLLPDHFLKIMEAAVFESQYGDCSLISVGFEMFETLDDVVQSTPEQNQIFWSKWPEFGFLFDHKLRKTAAVKVESLREQLQEKNGDAAHPILLKAFLSCLSSVLGYDVADLDPKSSLASYGVDSLNAVSCRYWFFMGECLGTWSSCSVS